MSLAVFPPEYVLLPLELEPPVLVGKGVVAVVFAVVGLGVGVGVGVGVPVQKYLMPKAVQVARFSSSRFPRSSAGKA